MLFGSYPSRNRVSLDTQLEHVRIPANKAIPFGLILNEIIANSLQHAFPDASSGTVKIVCRKIDGRIVLDISDSGIGLPRDFNLEKDGSLGFRLIRMLVNQLEGQMKLDNAAGTVLHINFKA